MHVGIVGIQCSSSAEQNSKVMHLYPTWNIEFICLDTCTETTAIPVYGLSAGRETVALENVTCTGNEPNIANCSTSPIGQISNPVCREPNRTAGVLCSTTDDYCAEAAVRLVDGPTFYEGRVEVCRNSRWMSVCDVGVNSSHAFIACERRFHFGGEFNVL